MGATHDMRYPGESDAYRKARNGLLAAELKLRKTVEEVAELRRGLPPGGALKEDYLFQEGAGDLADRETVRQVRFSELFEQGKESLFVYSFMYGPDWDQACPMCTAFLDSLNGNAVHVGRRVNLAVVARAPVEPIELFARDERDGWQSWGNEII